MWFDSLFNINLLCGDMGKKTQKKLVKMKNTIVWQNVFARLLQDALDRYHFEGLPETISERVFLQALLWYGGCAIFEKDDALLCLPCAQSGDGFNIYGDPASAWVFSMTGQLNENVKLYLPGSDETAFLKNTVTGKQTGETRGVYIRENAISFPFIQQVLFYADVIADTYRALDVCRENAKQPFIVVAEESIIESVKRFFEQRSENYTAIVSSGVFPADKIRLLPFESNSENIKNMTALIDWYFNKFKELCGVKNSGGNIDKKGENLITAEVEVNDEYTDLSIENSLKYIQKGLDDVNKLYGTNIRVVSNFNTETVEGDSYDEI